MTDPTNTTDIVGLPEDDAADLIAQLAQLAQDQTDGNPEPFAAGTFVLYPMSDGGFMFVTSVDKGPLAGIKHSRIRPGLIRAISIVASGGSRFAALKALGGIGRKEIGNAAE